MILNSLVLSHYIFLNFHRIIILAQAIFSSISLF